MTSIFTILGELDRHSVAHGKVKLGKPTVSVEQLGP